MLGERVTATGRLRLRLLLLRQVGVQRLARGRGKCHDAAGRCKERLLLLVVLVVVVLLW